MASYDNKLANGKALKAIKDTLDTKADSSSLGDAAYAEVATVAEVKQYLGITT